MSYPPSGIVDSLEIQTHELAQDNEAHQSSLIARSATSSVVKDGIHDDTNAATNRQDSQSPLFIGDETPSPSTPVTFDTFRPEIVARDGIQVIVPPVQRRWEHLSYDEESLSSKVSEENDNSEGSHDLLISSSLAEEKVGAVLFFKQVVIRSLNQ